MAQLRCQTEATLRWKGKHRGDFALTMRKGVKEKYKAVSARAGKSVTAFVAEAFVEKALREKLITEDQAKTLHDEDLEGTWVEEYMKEG